MQIVKSWGIHPLMDALNKALNAVNASAAANGGIPNHVLHADMRKAYFVWSEAGKPLYEVEKVNNY